MAAHPQCASFPGLRPEALTSSVVTNPKPTTYCASMMDGAGSKPGLLRAAGRWRPKGWTVEGELQGWQFQVEPVPGGLQVNATTPGLAPATWVVMTR